MFWLAKFLFVLQELSLKVSDALMLLKEERLLKTTCLTTSGVYHNVQLS